MINIGRGTYFADGKPTTREQLSSLTIGNFCSVAHLVIFDCGFQHAIANISQYPFNKAFPECYHLSGHPLSKGDINIGHDVWIGERAIIMSGVTIGNGAVVGANAVVTKSIPDYGIAVGVPARTIKYRFELDEIHMLNQIKWWDWSDSKIKSAAKYLMSNDIQGLLTFHHTYYGV
jgi:virginiamycin A acetyltransferase